MASIIVKPKLKSIYHYQIWIIFKKNLKNDCYDHISK